MHISLGFSFIEIVVSLFLLSLALLGLDAMCITALHERETAYYFSSATQQINNMVERLLIAHSDDVSEQLRIWNTQNLQTLPKGYGTVAMHTGDYQVSIMWGEQGSESCRRNKIGKSGCLQVTLNRDGSLLN